MKFLSKHFKWVRLAVHIGAWLPLIVLIHDALTDNLTFNPIQAATQRTGGIAVILLVLSLCCTPLNTYLHWKDAIRLRKPLGLYAFMYAGIHVFIFAIVDFSLQFNLIVPEFLQKYYLWVGLPAFLILLALAATSYRLAQRKLGKRWKTLHRLVYLAAILVVLHLALVIKGNFFRLSGDIWKPLVAGIAIGVLLIVRLPPLRRRFSRRRAIPDRPRPARSVPTSIENPLLEK